MVFKVLVGHLEGDIVLAELVHEGGNIDVSAMHREIIYAKNQNITLVLLLLR